MSEPKTFFIRKTWEEGDDDEGEFQYIIVEATRLGQYYSKDTSGYEYPGYCWSLEERTRFKSYASAQAYIEGLKAGYGEDDEAYIEHPTLTCSGGGPGKYPLDEDGGPLLFTIVSEK